MGVFMLSTEINNIPVYQYTQSFSRDQIDAVIQFIEVFGGNDKLLIFLRKLATGELLPKHKPQKKTPKEKESDVAIERERAIVKFMSVIGSCPKCGDELRGMSLRGCEQSKTGRHFYKECRSCGYYSEVFKKRKRFIEVEG